MLDVRLYLSKENKIYRKKSRRVRRRQEQKRAFVMRTQPRLRHTYRQPDTNLRMNHAQVYVNRTRPKYIYTPGAFTSSFERRFPHFRCTPPPLSTAIIRVVPARIC